MIIQLLLLSLATASFGLDCGPNGWLLPNNTCGCDTFVFGYQCEETNCLNGGRSPLENPCSCPPGYAGKACESTACGALVSSALDNKKRSLVILITASRAMQPDRDAIVNNLITAVDALQSNDNYINNFILAVTQRGSMNIQYFRDVYSMIDFLGSTELDREFTGPDSPNQIFYLLYDLQLLLNDALPYSTYLIFADKPNPLNCYTKLFEADDTMYQFMQTAIAWKNRFYFFISQTDSAPVNTTLPGYQCYRNIAAYTHGELFLVDKTEMPDVVRTVVAQLYKPEYIYVNSYFDCSQTTVAPLMRDFANQQVNMFVTFDGPINGTANPTVMVKSGNGNHTTQPLTRGKMWQIYNLPNAWENVWVQSEVPVTCSVRIFVGSDMSVLTSFLDINDYGINDIDGGNIVPTAEILTALTASVIGAPMNINSGKVNFFNANGDETYSDHIYNTKDQSCMFNMQAQTYNSDYAGFYRVQYNLNEGPFKVRREYPMMRGHSTVTAQNELSAADIKEIKEEAAKNKTEKIANVPEKAYKAPRVKSTPAEHEAKKIEFLNTNCPTMNTQALGLPGRSYRQIIFIVETTKNMNNVLEEFLFGFFESFIFELQDTDQFFGLVTVDQNDATAVFSGANANQFRNAVVNAFNAAMLNNTENVRDPIDWGYALRIASQMSVTGPVIVHAVGMSKPYQQTDFFLPKNFQFNFYHIGATLQENKDIWDLVRQTGGRYISLREEFLQSLQNVIVNANYYVNLVVDSTKPFVRDEVQFFDVPIESGATFVTFLITGTNVGISSLNDADGVPVDSWIISMQEPFALSFNIEMETNPAKAGLWSLGVSTTHGNVSVQVRTTSAVNFQVGFVSDPTDDFPTSQPFSRGSYNSSAFVAVRFMNSRSSMGVQLLNFMMYPISTLAPGQDPLDQMEFPFDLYGRGGNCAYQYISDVVDIPLVNNWKLVASGIDEQGAIIRREFYYYTPVTDYKDCNNRPIDTYGKCQCGKRFTGDNCGDKVCHNGGTNSKGVCTCRSGFYGAFCEFNVFSLNIATTTVAPTTTSSRPSTSTAPVTTRTTPMITTTTVTTVPLTTATTPVNVTNAIQSSTTTTTTTTVAPTTTKAGGSYTIQAVLALVLARLL